MKITPKQLYSEVLFFCKKNGYLQKLNASLKLSEQERFSNRKILKTGLDILDAVHCVIDENRTNIFLKEIKKYSKNKNLSFNSLRYRL